MASAHFGTSRTPPALVVVVMFQGSCHNHSPPLNSTVAHDSSSTNDSMFFARRVFKRCRGNESPDKSPTRTAPYSPSAPSVTTMCPEEEEEASESTYNQQPAAKRHRVDDFFPDFHLPDPAEVTDVSSDEESVTQRDEEFRTKEDEDVAVFLNLTKRMSLQSLLHLLQGAAKAQNNIIDDDEVENPMLEYSVLLTKHKTSESPTAKPVAKQKKFRFAEISDNRVREVVHYVESYKDISELWWSNEEMMTIRSDQVRVVKHFRKYRPQFIQSVETLVMGNEAPTVLEDHMRRLTEDSFARGLETHSVRCISERRKSHIQAVLQEQQDCRETGDCYDISSHCLMEQSLAYSQLLKEFALRMAKCDHIEALKASMSAWETPEPMILG